MDCWGQDQRVGDAAEEPKPTTLPQAGTGCCSYKSVPCEHVACFCLDLDPLWESVWCAQIRIGHMS